jgi:hypothetical protein
MVFLTHAAFADELVVPDPVGDKGPDMTFDIVSVSHGHAPATKNYPRFLAHTIKSETDASTSTLAQENTEIRINFDTKGDWRFERSVVVQFTSAGTSADMWRGGFPFGPGDFYEPNDWIGFVRVTRPDDRSVLVEFPRKMLGKLVHKSNPTSFRWMVEVYRMPWYRSFCGEGDASPCYDRTESARHRL